MRRIVALLLAAFALTAVACGDAGKPVKKYDFAVPDTSAIEAGVDAGVGDAKPADSAADHGQKDAAPKPDSKAKLDTAPHKG